MNEAIGDYLVSYSLKFKTISNVVQYIRQRDGIGYRSSRSFALACHHLQESLANAKVSARQPCWSKTDFDVK